MAKTKAILEVPNNDLKEVEQFFNFENFRLTPKYRAENRYQDEKVNLKRAMIGKPDDIVTFLDDI